MAIRDHEGTVLSEFNGLWQQGEEDTCPPDHFPDCENLKFVGINSFGTRDGIDIHQDVAVPLGNILRIFNYITQTANTLLVLREGGDIFHVVNNITVLGPILSIPEMTDFKCISYNGRAYITPFTTYGTAPFAKELGLEDEFVYVYKGDGTAARKAAGAGPPATPAMVVANGAAGNTDAGLHVFAVVFETDTGYLTAPGANVSFTTSANLSVSFSNIPVSADSFVVARRIVATKAIVGFNGDLEGYQFFFIPDGRIPNNVATVLANISFFDADLLEDASHLIDNFAEIPAGADINLYHNRMCVSAEFDNISITRVSAPGEPEAINQITGLLIAPLDGNPITKVNELRDVLYVFKKNRTISFVDNGDEPSSWPMSIVDYGIGCPVHGIAGVIDSGAANIDYLIGTSFKGIVIFNGRYAAPELSWKIADFWLEQDTNEFRQIQILNDTVNSIIYCTLPDGRMLIGNYANGLDPKKVRWTPFRADIRCTTIALIDPAQLIIGSIRRLFD